MNYLNPFELLQTFAGDSSGEWCDFAEKSLHRTRRQIIAEADLEGTLKFNQTNLSKNEIAAILDELDDEDRFENHRLIYENKLLLNFLTKGDAAIFDLDDEFDIYDYCNDFNLIAKPFAAQFDKLFTAAFKENDSYQIEQMSRFLIIVDDRNIHACFKSVENFLSVQLEEYETLISAIKNKKFDAGEVDSLLDQISDEVDAETLNALPDYFELRRDRLANKINLIAVNLYNHYSETETAFALSEIADQINAETLTQKNIKYNKGFFKDDLAQAEKDALAQAEFAEHLKKIERVAAIARELKQFTEDLNNRLVFGAKDNKLGNRLYMNVLKDQIRDILDFNEINSLSEELDFADNLRDSIALELKKLSIVSYNRANEVDFSLSLIEMALQIKVSPPTYSILVKSKNHLISKKQNAKYPSVNEKFRVNDNFTAADKSKTDFGQNKSSAHTDKQSNGENFNDRATATKTNNRKYERTPLFNYESTGKKSEFRQILIIVSGALVLVFGALIIYFNYSSGDKISRNEEFGKMNSVADFSIPEKISEKLNQLKLKPKLLPINAKTKTVDLDFYDQMPADIKTDLFREANTFAWLDCRYKQEIVSAHPLKSNLIVKCDLVAVDKAQNAVVLKKTFEEVPPSPKNGFPAETRQIFYQHIINYLIENSEK